MLQIQYFDQYTFRYQTSPFTKTFEKIDFASYRNLICNRYDCNAGDGSCSEKYGKYEDFRKNVFHGRDVVTK